MPESDARGEGLFENLVFTSRVCLNSGLSSASPEIS